MRITADHYYDESKLMDIRVATTLGLTDDDVKSIAAVSGVEDVEPTYSTHVMCNANGNEMVVEVMSATEKLNKITVVDGRMPKSADEILVEPRFLDDSGYKIGDTIQFTSGTEEKLSDQLKNDRFKIVGTGTTAYYLSFQRGSANIGSGDVDSFVVILPEVFNLPAYSGVYASVKGARNLTSYTDAYDNKIKEVVNNIKDISETQSKKRYDELYKEASDKIAASEADLKKLKAPTWYVLDRSSIEAYVEYEQNADRIGAIGEVFPVIFFLVAALISLTTMTRMVEEERTQIGILKALGYSKKAIAAKYILYALLATLGGSIAGALVGLKVLPTVIITAYKIMYRNNPQIYTPLNTYYAALATVLSVFTVGFATLIACYKELLAKPAELMRPVAPKNGKRVILEKIPFIWKRLSFTWKATIRNLIRYKKRFFMTVFGIGGCMALLLVGFGLKDSIFVIYTRQFDEIMLYDASVGIKGEATDTQKSSLENEINNNSKISDSLKVRERSLSISHDNKEKTVSLIVPEGGS